MEGALLSAVAGRRLECARVCLRETLCARKGAGDTEGVIFMSILNGERGGGVGRGVRGEFTSSNGVCGGGFDFFFNQKEGLLESNLGTVSLGAAGFGSSPLAFFVESVVARPRRAEAPCENPLVRLGILPSNDILGEIDCSGDVLSLCALLDLRTVRVDGPASGMDTSSWDLWTSEGIADADA